MIWIGISFCVSNRVIRSNECSAPWMLTESTSSVSFYLYGVILLFCVSQMSFMRKNYDFHCTRFDCVCVCSEHIYSIQVYKWCVQIYGHRAWSNINICTAVCNFIFSVFVFCFTAAVFCFRARLNKWTIRKRLDSGSSSNQQMKKRTITIGGKVEVKEEDQDEQYIYNMLFS